MPKTGKFLVGRDWGDFKAFFEQDDNTAYLYLCDDERILANLHIYNRSPEQSIRREDVDIVRAGNRFGVLIDGKLKGVVGTNGDCHRPAYTMRGKGVVKTDWILGFEAAQRTTKRISRPFATGLRKKYWQAVAAANAAERRRVN
jgi:hypothetical protein